MKLTLQHLSIRSTDTLDAWIENQIFSLQSALRIDEASVSLSHERDSSPAYRVHVHLVTPGPDVFAEGHDHTLRAAFVKVMTQLKNKISERKAKRLDRARAQLSAAPAKSRAARISRWIQGYAIPCDNGTESQTGGGSTHQHRIRRLRRAARPRIAP